MDNAIYNKIGQNYSQYRQADPRVVDAIVGLLGLSKGSVIAEIGAGTGNYSRAFTEKGYLVKAVEPSEVMRSQAGGSQAVEWISGVAEELPIKGGSVDATIVIFSFHHFCKPTKALSEMVRITKEGPILLFTFDPRQIEPPWLAEYFPSVWEEAFTLFLPLDELTRLVESITARKVTTQIFELPHDLRDYVAAAGWRRPEIYLDPVVRSCMSAFALADQKIINGGVAKLKADLLSGAWDEKYGRLRSLESLDVGYRFVCSRRLA